MTATRGPLDLPEASADATEAPDATVAVRAARRGLKRDVQALIAALEGTPLLVPLARKIEDVDLGVVEEVGDELSLSPHLLFDSEKEGYMPVFTRPELVERATDHIGWTTDDGPLEYCSLPAPVVLELALALLEDPRVLGLLVNPFDDTELVLRRHEVASIAQGRALPLVGYVVDIPLGDDEERLVAEMDSPPPPEVIAAVETVLGETRATAGTSESSADAAGAAAGASAPSFAGFTLHRTFNAERDLEPHLTLNVSLEDDGVDRAALAARLAAALEGKLPPPGYIDILFNDPLLR